MYQSTKRLDLIHSDVCGPLSVNSIGGSRYFVTFIDNFSRYIVVYPMKHKSEIHQKFTEYRLMVENMFECKIKRIRSDNGGEYTSNEFVDYLKQNGILEDETIPYSPQQNGVAERCNRTLMESVRSMLYHSNSPLKFWAKALVTAVHIRNRSPTSCFLGETPYERWYKEKPDVGHFRVFGCNAYMHVPVEKRKKLDKKSVKCVFVGYPNQSKGYKLYEPSTGKMLRSRDVIFIENEFSNPCDGNDEPDELFPDKWFQSNMFNLHDDYLPDKEKTIDPLNDAVVDVRNDDSETEPLVNLEVAHEVRNEVFNNDEVPENEIRIQDRPQRNRTIPDRYGWGYANVVIAEEPQNINEALNGQYADQWKEAAQNEFNSLIANGTWDLVDLPEN